MIEQLPLPLRLGTELPQLDQFDFSANPVLQLALAERLQGAGGQPPLLILGAPGAGKSHVLAGTAQQWLEEGRAVRLLPLKQVRTQPPESLGLEQDTAWLLDDVDVVLGDAAWERALFALYNRQHDAAGQLLLSATALPAVTQFALPDLASRLHQCTRLDLKPLSEQARLKVLHQRAAARGLEMPQALLDWLQVNYSRDLARLLALLKELDQLSLSRGRKLSIPLVRELLNRDAV